MRIGEWGMGNGEWGMGVLAGSTGGLTEWRVNRSTAGFDVNTKASGSERAMPDKSLVYCPGTTDLRRLFRSGTGNQAARDSSLRLSEIVVIECSLDCKDYGICS
ncbi:hypothetical protein HZH66_001944 [Vespula vulgaris]|uniref:Uncharacterized protein n=1 Tax=Vespula vulgaris TaxID=7454 RepID=A0A834KIZ5_VESVU|nr:hypothetical protein HZH66_001944 [Vespula vulgaris]